MNNINIIDELLIVDPFVSLAKSPVSTEEKVPDSVCDNGVKRSAAATGNSNTPNRTKKRKKAPRDATAPRQPLSGYFL